MTRSPFRRLTAPLVGTGTCMAAYLLVRPYGDHSTDLLQQATALASWRWIVGHLFGVAAIAQFAWVGLRLEEAVPHDASRATRRLARAARATGLVGAVASLPYYGMETFGLHILGRWHLASAQVDFPLLVEQMRNHPAALTTFGIGLVSLAASGVLMALAWQRTARPRWAAWPLGALMVGFLPQFLLPDAGRIGYGVAYCAAALVLATTTARNTSRRH